MDLLEALRVLAKRGVTRVFSEGGPTVARELVALGLADEVALFTSPKPLGYAGVEALDADTRAALKDENRFQVLSETTLGVDRLRIYERRS